MTEIEYLDAFTKIMLLKKMIQDLTHEQKELENAVHPYIADYFVSSPSSTVLNYSFAESATSFCYDKVMTTLAQAPW